jgi:hypothetical protein
LIKLCQSSRIIINCVPDYNTEALLSRKIAAALALFVFALAIVPRCLPAEKRVISQEDRQYLEKLLRATWDYCDFFTAPKTGFPYDSNLRPTGTNTTNIGLYLADLAVAHHLGYIKKEDALSRARKVINSLGKIENWNGLYNNILDTNGATKAYAGENNISDYNKLPAGLIMLKQEFPELRSECSAMLNRINWSVFYAPAIGGINYAFDVVKQNTFGPTNISRGEDKVLGAFLCVASGGVPPSTWDHHAMDKEERYGFKYFKPGWQGGGLFMQFICGLFLDETGTELGYSSANFAFAQIEHAQRINSPAWGWSASAEPDGGYIGWNSLKDEVVTPHASALAIEFFPDKAVNNLKTLERLGARPKYKEGGKEYDFGFKDAYNTSTGRATLTYLVLDQSMLFLSAANYLHDGVVRKLFSSDPLVANGYRLLPAYNISSQDKSKFLDYLNSLKTRECGLSIVPFPFKQYFEPGETVSLQAAANNYTSADYTGSSLEWKFADSSTGKILGSGAEKLDLPVNSSVWSGVISCVVPRNTPRTSVISFSARLVDSRGKEIKSADENFALKNFLDLAGGWYFHTGDTAAWSKQDYKETGWKKLRVPATWEEQGYEGYDGFAWYRRHFTMTKDMLDAFGKSGLYAEFGDIDDADETFLNGTKIGGMGSFPPKPVTAYGNKRAYRIPDGLIKPGKDNVIAVRVHDSGGNGGIYKGPLKIGPSGPEVIYDLSSTSGWETYLDNGSNASLGTAAGADGRAMEISYDIGSGGWIGVRRTSMSDLSKYSGMAFTYKGTGKKNTFEVKLEDGDGSIFGKAVETGTSRGTWTQAVVPFSSMTYWWDGDKSLDLSKVKLHFAVSKRDRDDGGAGRLVIGSVRAYGGAGSRILPAVESGAGDIPSGVLDGVPGGWDVYKDRGVEVSLKQAKGEAGPALEMDYDLESGTWFGVRKEVTGEFENCRGVSFSFRGEGNPNTLEIKIEDGDGSVFGKLITVKSNASGWMPLRIPLSAMEHWSGGNNSLDLNGKLKLHFAVSLKDKDDKGGRGKLFVGRIAFYK